MTIRNASIRMQCATFVGTHATFPQYASRVAKEEPKRPTRAPSKARTVPWPIRWKQMLQPSQLQYAH